MPSLIFQGTRVTRIYSLWAGKKRSISPALSFCYKWESHSLPHPPRPV